jgi:hypothetical protein
MKVALIFNKDRSDTTGIYFQKALEAASIEFDHYPLEGIEKLIDNPRAYDLYLRIDHGDYKFDLHKKFSPAAFLAIDTHLKKPFKKICRAAKHYDFLFATQKEGAEFLAKKLRRSVYWMPLACDPDIHKKLDIEKLYDVGFVGSYGGKGSLREETLLYVKDKFKNSFIGNADYADMSRIYSASKIGINFSLNNDINMRIFEILSCGAMLLTSKVDDNGFEELFTEGEHLITYNDKEDLAQKIDYYLGHEDKRKQIAQAGYELVIKNHTYKNRLDKMFEIIASLNADKFKDLKI